MVDAQSAYDELELIQDITDAILAETTSILREYGINSSTMVNRVGPPVFGILVSKIGGDDARAIHNRNSAYIPPGPPIRTAPKLEPQVLDLDEKPMGKITGDEIAEAIGNSFRSLAEGAKKLVQEVVRDVALDTAAEALRSQTSKGRGQTATTTERDTPNE